MDAERRRNDRFDEEDDTQSNSRPWTQRMQEIAAILWPGFLAACAGTMLFFAFVDPEDLERALERPITLSRMSGYGIGFFFFWLISVISSAMSVYLVTTARKEKRNKEDRE